jgi:hypothetical protein
VCQRILLKLVQARSGLISVDKRRTFIKIQSTLDHLICRPLPSSFSIDIHDQMKVVGHDGIGTDINGKDGGQLFNPIQDILFAMVEALSSGPIKTKEKSTANTARDAVVIL